MDDVGKQLFCGFFGSLLLVGSFRGDLQIGYGMGGRNSHPATRGQRVTLFVFGLIFLSMCWFGWGLH